ncbi:MAG: glycerophosphodiester phosphodiesterase family protein, partial [Planctomycetes bacterium]|nr:glycerophosphodiester phosphodiesterase family protein [Planctomycetota bacterium]
SDLTLAELRAVRLLPQGRIPTLEEALRAARGRVILDLDLKTDRIDLVVAALQAEHMVESVLVFDSNPALLRRGRALEPRLRVLPKGRNLAEVRALIAEFDPPAIHLEALEQLTPEVRAALAAANCRAWLNALGAKDVLGCKRFYRKLARGGAQVIQTDRPARVLGALR